ncbi:hypothetical protein A2U01_0090918, partial [Trifolium medium]|nr:hypothetical protein [Trifolium medium]
TPPKVMAFLAVELTDFLGCCSDSTLSSDFPSNLNCKSTDSAFGNYPHT